MLVSFQFPLSDARAFDPDAGLRLGVPDWPNPTTEITPQFVHRFGRAMDRVRQADEAWPDEIKFCHARRALRFEDLARHPAGIEGARFLPACAFRRLFCDGQSVVRVEIGLTHNHRARPLTRLDARQVLAMVQDLSALPTGVPQAPAGVARKPLLRQGPSLARLYARSTLGPSTAKASRSETLVQAGNPLALVELRSDEAEFPLVPDGFHRVAPDKVHGASASFGRVRTPAGVVGVWVLQRGEATDDQARSIRLCLMRLHAEQEGLDLILKQIHRGNLLNPSDDRVVDDLDTYFNDRTKIINRQDWSGIKQSAILGAFDAADEVTPPATRQNLADRYKGARQQIWKKVDDYQKRRAAVREINVVHVEKDGIRLVKNVAVNQSGVGNVANVAELMSGVTTTVNNDLARSPAASAVRDEIAELTRQLAEISPKLDPKLTRRMGSDVQALSAEVAQPEPRRPWLELPLRELQQDATAAGDVATGVAATVARLVALLLQS